MMTVTVGWWGRAACVGQDTAVFFPLGSGQRCAEQVEAAKTLCTACPVRQPCLEWALRTRQDIGVWGGTDAAERRALRKRRRHS